MQIASQKSATLYQQIKAIAQADEQRLVAFRDDLFKEDRSTLRTVKPSDQWIWILRECGTNLFACPLTYAAQLLREGIGEYDPKITTALTTNFDWMNAVVNEHLRSSRQVRGKAFRLVYSLDGEQTVTQINDQTAEDLMRWNRWQAFQDWRETVLVMASGMSLDTADSHQGDWWNTAAIGWTTLDWLEHHRAALSSKAVADPKVYTKEIATLAIEAMKSAAVLSNSGETQQC
ncbi:MAG: hypothetical protein KME07_09275 [Pegethrix bostrychoides GSE-TBD4-15B]|jgi:hypothetical protein|uniref:Uncharacterized protein n=1 Tax=Pegethrix bostrychoides GSE-TBD4-15B TaxID=2839662 RepID=A0A951U4P1_9CYAN|nr:hypothetical protein [Pegethrix bostrychoides GSE-TBD4-15B]